MTLTADIVRLIQRALGFTGSDVDGILGQQTENALDDFLSKNRDKLAPQHVEAILKAGRRRKIVAFGQIRALDRGIETGKVDGFLGPQTDYAFKVLLFVVRYGKMPFNWRDHKDIPNPNNWPRDSRDQREVMDFYGRPGDQSQLIKVRLPYTQKLSWDRSTRVKHVFCHRKVADSMLRVLTNVREHYGERGIKDLGLDITGGCFNARRKRGGTTWSTHAWGAAIDYDPDNNQLHWGWDQATFSRPDYDKWWECWEEEGWIALGRVRNFDWMHVQAIRI